jgi:hypothetical protein
MANEKPATPKQMLLIGTACAGAGLYFMLVGAGELPVPGGPGNLHAPLWIVVCAGLVFILGGAALLLQGLGKANANAEMPPNAPIWMRAAQRLFVVVIFACFALTGSWVAVFGDARQFSGPFTSFGFGVLIARAVFGLGALICWAVTIGLVVSSVRLLASARKMS